MNSEVHTHSGGSLRDVTTSSSACQLASPLIEETQHIGWLEPCPCMDDALDVPRRAVFMHLRTRLGNQSIIQRVEPWSHDHSLLLHDVPLFTCLDKVTRNF